MHGLVWEWCLDTYYDNYEAAPIDGSAWIKDNDNQIAIEKLLRGGSWVNIPYYCRSACRDRYGSINNISKDISFRVVCGGVARTL